MKFILVTAYSKKYRELVKLTMPSKINYCDRHGYELFVARHSEPFDIWERVEIWRRALLSMKNGDWMFFLGADTIITNPTITLEHILLASDVRTSAEAGDCAYQEKDLLICKDILGINDDSMLWKAGPGALMLLRKTMEFRADFPDDDQAGLRKALELPPEETHWKVAYPPQCMMNSYFYDLYPHAKDADQQIVEEGTWQPTHFVLHLPGLSNSIRLPILKEFLRNGCQRKIPHESHS